LRLNLCCWLTARMTRLSTSAPLLSLLRRARLAPTDQAAVHVRDLTIGHHPMQRSARGPTVPSAGATARHPRRRVQKRHTACTSNSTGWPRDGSTSTGSAARGPCRRPAGPARLRDPSLPGSLTMCFAIRFYNNRRGYVRTRFSEGRWRGFSGRSPLSWPGAPVQTRASFAVPDGQPGLQTA
jgi:hypothetical protein